MGLVSSYKSLTIGEVILCKAQGAIKWGLQQAAIRGSLIQDWNAFILSTELPQVMSTVGPHES